MGYAIYDAFQGKPDYGKKAADQEKQRQQQIQLGTNQINAIFDGGQAPSYSQATGTFDPSQQYYHMTNKGYQPYYIPPTKGKADVGKDMALGAAAGGIVPGIGNIAGANIGGTIGAFQNGDVGGILTGGLSSLFGDDKSPLDVAKSRFKKGRLFTKTDNTYTGFGKDFYDKRAQDYIDYENPFLSQQYNQARNQIGFGLANRGLQKSSQAQREFSGLDRQNDIAKQGIVDAGRQQAQSLQNNVESQRDRLLGQLYQSADPAAASKSAISSAAGFAAPSTFAPLANQFGGLAQQYYLSQALNNYRGGGGMTSQDTGANDFSSSLPGSYKSF